MKPSRESPMSRRFMKSSKDGIRARAIWIGYTKEGAEIFQAIQGWEPDFPYTFDENRNWIKVDAEAPEPGANKKPINIRLDPSLLRRIDNAGERMRRNRTQIIEEGAMKLILEWEKRYNNGEPFPEPAPAPDDE